MNHPVLPKGMDLSVKTGVSTSFWDYSGLLFSNLILIPLRALAAVMTARILGTEGYGIIALYSSVVGLVILFTSNWTVAPVLRFGREEYDRRGTIHHTFWARNLILAPLVAVGILLVIVLNGPISRYIGMPRWAVGLLIASVAASILFNYTEYILQAIHRMRAFAAMQVMMNTLSVVGLGLVFFKLLRGDYLTVIIIGILSGTLTTIGAFFWVPRRFLFPVELDRQTLTEVFLFSYPIILGSIASYIVAWVDVFVINTYFSKSAVGGYQLAYQIFTVVIGVIMTTTVLTAPILMSFIANGREELIRRYASRLVPQGVLFWSVAVGLGLTFSRPVFEMVFGPQFGVSSIYFQYLAFAAALNSLVCFNSGILTAYKLIKSSVMVSVCTAVLNLSLDLLLVPRMGPLGAAISTATAIGVHALLYLAICQRQLQERLTWQLVLVLPALLSLAVSRFAQGWEWSILALGATLASGYSLAKALHLFRYEDLSLLEYIQMPAVLKKAVLRIYPFLASKPG